MATTADSRHPNTEMTSAADLSSGEHPDALRRAAAPVPALSVIVPAHNAAGQLDRCLGALKASESTGASCELIVVDDGSTDTTALVAARYADVVVQLGGSPNGPAYARNRGVETSRGQILVFVDADVIVHADALPRIVAAFRDHPDVSAVFGSYDARPMDRGVVSQYRNLLHHHVHQRNAGEAETFWAGLGAMRRDAFLEAGMYDEWHYSRPQIEDIELGRRLRNSGRRILLKPEIQGTHLKRWTLGGMLRTDLESRGVPWMRLLLREGPTPTSHTLNLRPREKWCTAFVGAGMLAVAIGVVWAEPFALLAGLAALLIALGLNLQFIVFVGRAAGIRTGIATLGLHLLYYLNNVFSGTIGRLVYELFGAPQPSAARAAVASLGTPTWPPPPRAPTSGIWSGPRKSARNGSRPNGSA